MSHFTYQTAIREILTPYEPLNPVHERHLVCRGFYREKGLWVRRSYDKGPTDLGYRDAEPSEAWACRAIG